LPAECASEKILKIGQYLMKMDKSKVARFYGLWCIYQWKPENM